MKDYLRDYATAAFRFYAQNGMSAEKYKQKLYIEALDEIKKKETQVKDGISKPTEQALIAAEKAVNERISEINDMEAVDKVLAELEARHKKHIIKAIEIVYFKDADKEFTIGDIQDRVHVASTKIPAGERSIYRWLKQARELFSYQRGLRIYKVGSN
ncbi:hypothetical protein Ccar_16625 [Clostridium carboxidivorans P7]|uniref:hypothetical protein n=1 Tax=Clostridium carboxidivorans TaxID=217159 RepID=UPI00064EEB83|nr:hypothetical protein [Clostridium carboxidivorans]AKN32397.1 hypothetical protein Ccar_16625 [Clostridium carboxidivorans P7]